MVDVMSSRLYFKSVFLSTRTVYAIAQSNPTQTCLISAECVTGASDSSVNFMKVKTPRLLISLSTGLFRFPLDPH